MKSMKRLLGSRLFRTLPWVAAFPIGNLYAQQYATAVQGRVEWYTNHKPVAKGSVRLEVIDALAGLNRRAESRFLRENGEFSFDFGALRLTGGEQIQIFVKDAQNQDLKVILPLEGNANAPKPPKADWVVEVARPDEQIRLADDPELTRKYIAWVIVRQPPEDAAAACDPGPQFYAWAGSEFKLPPQTVSESLEKWSIVTDGVRWSPAADLTVRCRAWHSGQIVALSKKLQEDSNLLGSVRQYTPADKLRPLYLETAKTNAALGAMYFQVKDYSAAKTYLQNAIADFDQAGTDAEAKQQVRTLIEKLQQGKYAF